MNTKKMEKKFLKTMKYRENKKYELPFSEVWELYKKFNNIDMKIEEDHLLFEVYKNELNIVRQIEIYENNEPDPCMYQFKIEVSFMNELSMEDTVEWSMDYESHSAFYEVIEKNEQFKVSMSSDIEKVTMYLDEI